MCATRIRDPKTGRFVPVPAKASASVPHVPPGSAPRSALWLLMAVVAGLVLAAMFGGR